MIADLINEKGLPHSLEAERCVLGAIILENEALYQVLDSLSPDDFYSESHKILYQTCVNRITLGQGVDLVLLKDAMAAAGDLDLIGGVTYVASLIDAVPTARNIAHYAQIVKQKAIARGLILAGYEIIDEVYKQDKEPEEILEDAQGKLFGITDKTLASRRGFKTLRETGPETWERVEQIAENKGRLTGLLSGYVDLDNLTLGFHPGQLIIIAGRPSMGKTAFALNIAENVSVTMDAEKSTGIFSIEMSAGEINMRLLSSVARVNSLRIRNGSCDKGEWERMFSAMNRLASARISIDDSSRLTPNDVLARGRRLKAERGLDLLIVDYLQLMTAKGKFDNRQQEITTISRMLKETAKELQVPIIALSQLHREPERRANKQPQLSDLRESGAIEQDADVVLFIYRDEVYERTPENAGVASLLLKKQRNGPAPETLDLTFLSQFTRFESKAFEYGQ